MYSGSSVAFIKATTSSTAELYIISSIIFFTIDLFEICLHNVKQNLYTSAFSTLLFIFCKK